MEASATLPSGLIVLDEVASTNQELLDRARAGAPHGTALRARVQRAGRGRRTHAWASPDGGLYLSILVRRPLPAAVLPGLPVVCALGVAEALEAVGVRDLRLKWPNDIVLPQGKLGGILVEARSASSETVAVCGIGINIHMPDAGARMPGALPITCLDSCLGTGHGVTPDALAVLIRARVLAVAKRWERAVADAQDRATPLTGIHEAYHERLAYLGEQVRAVAPDGTCAALGTFSGVDPWGRALIASKSGGTSAHDAAVVSLRPQRKGGITMQSE